MVDSGLFGSEEVGIEIADADGIKQFPMDEIFLEEVFTALINQLEKQSDYI